MLVRFGTEKLAWSKDDTKIVVYHSGYVFKYQDTESEQKKLIKSYYHACRFKHKKKVATAVGGKLFNKLTLL